MTAVVAAYRSDIWRMPDGEFYGQIRDLQNSLYPRSFAFTPDSKMIVSVNHDVLRFWKVQPGRQDEPLLFYNQGFNGVKSMAVSPKGDLIALGTNDGKVMVIRTPVIITEAKRVGDQFMLEWLGGAGRYQVQESLNLDVSTWENVGEPTSANTFSATLSGKSMFYRVLSVPE